MPVDEFQIDEELVRRLVAGQFPEWADQPLRRVEPAGTVNAIFRLGDDLSVRLARRNGRSQPGGREFDWLPRLVALLPLSIPVPVAQGRPTAEYPWFWDVHTWVDGETVPVEDVDAISAARDLAGFVAALQKVNPAGAPPGRGIPLANRDEEIRYWLARFDGDPRVAAEWKRALTAPPWDGPHVWHHGDLDVRNWLVRDGRMRRLLIALSAFVVLTACGDTQTSDVAPTTSPTTAPSATSTPSPSPRPAPTSTPIAPPAQAPQPVSHADYLAELRAEGVSAICNDGTFSYSRNRSGTCSHHGGVREWTGLI